GLACIELGQIAAPMDDKGMTLSPDAASDGGPSPDAATGSAGFGGSCRGNQDCAQGTCVDGICCRHGSGRLCQVCAFGGDWVNVSVGVIDPHARCYPMDSPQSCGRSGACDGAGACANYPLGTECRKGTCDGDGVVGASVCDGAGQCKPTTRRVCV